MTLREYLLDLSETDLIERFSERIYRRGVDYQVHDQVGAILVAPGQVTAVVFGSENYHLRLFRNGGRYFDMVCNCPYEAECKHMVAVLLELRERAGTAEVALFDLAPEDDPFHHYVDHLPKKELRRLLKELAPEHFRAGIRKQYGSDADREWDEFRELTD